MPTETFVITFKSKNVATTTTHITIKMNEQSEKKKRKTIKNRREKNVYI